MSHSRVSADLGLVVVTMIWGLTFPAIKVAMDAGASPLAFIAVRFAIAGAILIPFVVLRGGRVPEGILPGIVLGLVLGGAFAAQTVGLTHTTAARSGFITGTTVVIVPFLDRIVFKRTMSGWSLAGAGVVLGGLFVLSGVTDFASLLDVNVGDVWTLGCAVLYAIYLVFLQPHLERQPHGPFLAIQIFAVTCAAAIAAAFVEDVRIVTTPDVVGVILFLAVFATIGTGLLQFRFQARSTAVRTALIFSLEPIFAATSAMVLIGERPTANVFVGGGVMVLGILVAEVGPKLRT